MNKFFLAFFAIIIVGGLAANNRPPSPHATNTIDYAKAIAEVKAKFPETTPQVDYRNGHYAAEWKIVDAHCKGHRACDYERQWLPACDNWKSRRKNYANINELQNMKMQEICDEMVRLVRKKVS